EIEQEYFKIWRNGNHNGRKRRTVQNETAALMKEPKVYDESVFEGLDQMSKFDMAATMDSLTRRNTFNGKSYKEDPVIFAWGLANEPQIVWEIMGERDRQDMDRRKCKGNQGSGCKSLGDDRSRREEYLGGRQGYCRVQEWYWSTTRTPEKLTQNDN
ncbi:1029_t:CDS:2, partial [Paraglomus brasilianum]